ncbi:MAG: glycosyltransferase family 39 protein [Streptosporangiaceae bacterium]
MSARPGGKTSSTPVAPPSSEGQAASGVSATEPEVPRPDPAGGRTAAAARYLPVGLAAAVMLVLGLWGLARQSAMGNDEVATRWAALLPLRELFHLLNNVDAVHGLYYLLMHAWMVVGTSPAVMRIPSVISMVVAVALTVILGRRLTGSGWAGLFAGLIMALTPTITYYAQTARSYALVVACVLGATLVLLHALAAEAAGAPGSRVVRWWLGYGALMLLVGYLNELALLVLTAHLVTVLLARYGRAALRHWAVAGITAAVLVGPLAVVSAREDKAVNWIPRPGPGAIRVLFHDYFGATTGIAVLLFLCAVAALLPPRASWRGSSGSGSGSASGPARFAGAWWTQSGVSLPSVAGPLVVLPAFLLILESVIARPLYVDRYVLYGEAAAALLAGAGLYRIGRWLTSTSLGNSAARRRALIWVPGIVVCAAALVLQIAPQQRIRTGGSRMFNLGAPSQYVAAHARPGDGILFFGPFFRKARLGYPADYRDVRDFAMARTPLQAGTFQGTDQPPNAVAPLILGYHGRIWVMGNAPSASLSAPALAQESNQLMNSFTLVTKLHWKGVTLTLWVRP